MKRYSQGFTLLELLIAVVVFAVMSTMAYSSLGIALSHRQQAEVQADRLAELQKFFTIMGRDIEQTVNRPVRNALGSEEKAIVGTNYGSQILELSRAGLSNPMKMARSSLQRVGYTLRDGELVRLSWLVLDRTHGTEPYESVLLKDVESIHLQYMNENHVWQGYWPEENFGASSTLPRALPRAIEVVVELENWGKVRRVFEVAG